MDGFMTVWLPSIWQMVSSRHQMMIRFNLRVRRTHSFLMNSSSTLVTLWRWFPQAGNNDKYINVFIYKCIYTCIIIHKCIIINKCIHKQMLLQWCPNIQAYKGTSFFQDTHLFNPIKSHERKFWSWLWCMSNVDQPQPPNSGDQYWFPDANFTVYPWKSVSY